MKETWRLTLAAPAQTHTIQQGFNASTLQVQNPTGSTIYVRTTGTDIPNSQNFDYIVLPQSTAQFPVSGINFAGAFENTTILGTQAFPATVAIFTAFSAGEPVGQIGSIQGGLARLDFYDRNPLEIIASGRHLLSDNSTFTALNYVVPANRKFAIGSIMIQCYRTTRPLWLATADKMSTGFAVLYPGGVVGTLNTFSQVIANSYRPQVVHESHYEPSNLILQATDQLVLYAVGDQIPPAGSILWFLSLSGTEFDA